MGVKTHIGNWITAFMVAQYFLSNCEMPKAVEKSVANICEKYEIIADISYALFSKGVADGIIDYVASTANKTPQTYSQNSIYLLGYQKGFQDMQEKVALMDNGGKY